MNFLIDFKKSYKPQKTRYFFTSGLGTLYIGTRYKVKKPILEIKNNLKKKNTINKKTYEGTTQT